MPRMDIQNAADPLVGSWAGARKDPSVVELEDRLVVVVQERKGTYWYHLLDSGEAHVLKSEDALTPTYTIKDGICSCPAAIHSKLCKHIKMVTNFAAG